ncbi:MAG: hypothetical protein ACREB9_02130 [Thermoplasmata archaeon]
MLALPQIAQPMLAARLNRVSPRDFEPRPRALFAPCASAPKPTSRPTPRAGETPGP